MYMKQIKILIICIIVMVECQSTCFSQYIVGDTLKFWSVTYIDWPPLAGSPQREINAVCQKAGDHCYIFVEDIVPLPSQASMDALVSEFDNHFYDSLTAVYGPVPDVFDNDSNIFILILDESNWSGYFDPGQQMADTFVYSHWNRHSSQREIIYTTSTSLNTVAHELGHLLHWKQDHSPEPMVNPVKYWEDAWIDEGFSTFAAIYLTTNIYQHNVLDNSAFFASNPDIPLIYFSNYNQAKLFMLFMWEHFGKWNYISALISNQLNGIDGIESTLDNLGFTESFDDAFEQWVIANYADDSVYVNGKYSYIHYRFPSCYVSANYNPYPTGTKNATISSYGSDYVSFTSSTPAPIQIIFNGQPDSKFRLNFILKNTVTNIIDSVISVPLDVSNHAVFIAPDLGINYNKVIMAVMNVDSTIHETSTAAYSYSASLYSGNKECLFENNITVFPNPVSEKLFIVSQGNRNSLLVINDIQGKECVRNEFSSTTMLDVSSLPNGMYVLRIINNEKIYIQKFIKE